MGMEVEIISLEKYEDLTVNRKRWKDEEIQQNKIKKNQASFNLILYKPEVSEILASPSKNNFH